MLYQIISFYAYRVFSKFLFWRTSPSYSKAVLLSLLGESNPNSTTEYLTIFKNFCKTKFSHDLHGDALLVQWGDEENGTFTLDFTRQFSYNSFFINEHMDQCSLTLSIVKNSELKEVEAGNTWSFREDNTTMPMPEFFAQIESNPIIKSIFTHSKILSHNVSYSRLYSS